MSTTAPALTAPKNPAPKTLSIEKYLRTSYRPDREYVDGQLQERNVGEFEHSRIQALIAAWLIQNEMSWDIVTVTEQRIRVAPGSVRIPDVCALRRLTPRERVIETPPLLCVEVLSPEDRLARTVKVMEDYLAMGVPNLCIVDPIQRSPTPTQPPACSAPKAPTSKSPAPPSSSTSPPSSPPSIR